MSHGSRQGYQHNIKAFIRKGENYYVAECFEIAVVTQGTTLDETIANLKEAVSFKSGIGKRLERIGSLPLGWSQLHPWPSQKPSHSESSR